MRGQFGKPLVEAQPRTLGDGCLTLYAADVSVAQVALGLSVASLTWQVVSFLMNGFRIKIKVQAVLVSLDGSSLIASLGAREPEAEHGMKRFQAEYWMELLRVEITNTGRIATSVSETGVLFSSPPWGELAPAVVVRDGTGASTKTSTVIRRTEWLECFKGVAELPIRLEPGESVNFVYDFWPMAEAHIAEHPDDRSFYIQGVARAAGGRMRRSAWRNRWKLDRSTESFTRVRLTRLQRAYRGFWRGHGCEQPAQAEQAFLAGADLLRQGHDFASVASQMGRFTSSNENRAAIEMEFEYNKSDS